MNKLSINKKNSAQAGFTLIELIVVIVILGILAATALPKFTSLSGEARLASLQSARGALSATAAMAHGKHLLNPANGTENFEGFTVTFPVAPATLTGYPLADNGFVGAAGLSQDYTTVPGGAAGAAAGATTPVVPANGIAIIPNGIAGTATAIKCFITYTAPTAANSAPVLSNLPALADCQ